MPGCREPVQLLRKGIGSSVPLVDDLPALRSWASVLAPYPVADVSKTITDLVRGNVGNFHEHMLVGEFEGDVPLQPVNVSGKSFRNDGYGSSLRVDAPNIAEDVRLFLHAVDGTPGNSESFNDHNLTTAYHEFLWEHVEKSNITTSSVLTVVNGYSRGPGGFNGFRFFNHREKSVGSIGTDGLEALGRIFEALGAAIGVKEPQRVQEAIANHLATRPGKETMVEVRETTKSRTTGDMRVTVSRLPAGDTEEYYAEVPMVPNGSDQK
jgi:hypothetical protein